MAGSKAQSSDNNQERRKLLKLAGLGAMAAGLASVLSRRPFGAAKSGGRTIPADLPGEGSIFRPRGDKRSR